MPWFLLDPARAAAACCTRGILRHRAIPDCTRWDSLQVTGGLAADHFEEVVLAGRTLRAPTGYFGPYTGQLRTTPPISGTTFSLNTHPSPPLTGTLPRLTTTPGTSLGLAVDEASCMRELRAAADLGADVFHLDAGWYRAPGDWRPDPKRFPHGLRPLVEEAHRRGMKFGLWVAFTQISEPLLKQHPDWVTTPGAGSTRTGPTLSGRSPSAWETRTPAPGSGESWIGSLPITASTCWNTISR